MKKLELRNIIREEIRRIIKERDLGIKFVEKQWNDDEADERKRFLKKFSNSSFKFKSFKPEKFIGQSFKELPSDVQKAWEYYITKMK